jgi:acylphosphatase
VAVVHLKVEGRVQGVGFRWFVRQEAEGLGLAGWVRNTPDGAVEIAARGDEGAIASLVATAGMGPPGSLVTAVNHIAPPAGTDYPEPFGIVT